MKNKMRITGNRTVIGIICIVLALGITFGIAPLVNRFTDRKVEVVQVKQNVERGHLITEDDVELVKGGALNLSDRTVKNRKYVVGKYAATNLYAGQIMIADLVAEKSNSADDVLSCSASRMGSPKSSCSSRRKSTPGQYRVLCAGAVQ